MNLDHIDPYPFFLNKRLDLIVNEQLVHTRIPASEWTDHWRPFLARLHDLWLARFPKRFLIAIAGPPGSGKSVLAEQLHWIIEKGFLHKDARTVALPMDGFHFPTAHLQSHFRKLPDGTQIPLSDVKGQPDTISVTQLRHGIQALVDRPEFVPWPGYSRFTHDVVPGKYKVHTSHNLIIIEGNYLLVNRSSFAGIPDLFDLRVYVDGPGPKIIANLVDRHIAGGKNLHDAKEWVKRIDLPNARIAESTKPHADVIFERDEQSDLISIIWKADSPSLNPPLEPTPPIAEQPTSHDSRHPHANHATHATPIQSPPRSTTPHPTDTPPPHPLPHQ